MPADPDAVAVLSRCLHLAQCPPPKRSCWSDGHFIPHDQLAEALVAFLDMAGKEIANKEH